MGEAANPGPMPNGDFSIGCINPTGLLGRGQLIADLPKATGSSLWAVSETHLTAPGRAKFQKELKYHKAGYHLQAGADTPCRSNTATAIAGKHRGVAFLSTCPSRAMTATWPKQQWEESRFHASCFQVGSRWVQGGVVYGHAAQAETIATRTKTDQICQYITERLLQHSHGLRFIAGDLNQPDGALQNMLAWKEAGWVNVQQWALERLGKPIEVTCKNKTTKDHIYVSPELAQYLKDVEVQQDWFPDHAVLIAKFHPLGKPPQLPIWRQPKPMPWDDIPLEAIQYEYQKPESQQDLTASYAQVCTNVEAAAALALTAKHKALPDACKGRVKTTEVRWRQEYSAPLRPSREGEYQPTYHGLNIQHARWIRQYRRILNFTRLPPEVTGNALTHRRKLWHSIKTAPGFAPCFAQWWMDNTRESLPVEAPSHQISVSICSHFHKHLQAFEKALNQQRTAAAKQRRVDDPMIIFRDLKQPPPQPVQMLLNRPTANITHVEDHECAIEVSQEKHWDTAIPLQTPVGQANIIHAEQDKLWLDNVEGLQSGQMVSQDKYIGDLTELFEQFGQEWSRRWDRHLHVDPNRWNPIISFAEQVLPRPPPMKCDPISIEEWDSAIKRKSKRAATGPDGVSREDMLHWPAEAKQALLEIFHRIENGEQWPRQMVTGFVVALEKTPGAETVNQYRPITLFSLCYRTWSSIRARQVLAHLAPLAPSTCTGNLPGKHSAHVWYGVMQEIELAQLNQGSLSGWVVDLIKAFNMLPRTPIMHFMALLNVAPRIMLAWGNALVSMERRFKLHNCVGPSLRSTTGYPEGCALSVTAMLAHNLVGHFYMRLRHPSVTLWSYVDNIEATAPSSEPALRALEAFHQYSDLMDVAIDNDKSYAWSVNASQRKNLRAEEMITKLSARDLGGHVQYSKVVTNATITNRCEEIKALWGRLARSLAPYAQKVRALITKAWPSCLHGVSSVHMADDHFDKLRTGALQGLGEHSSGASPYIHLALIEGPAVDPQYYALLQTVMMYREHNLTDDCTLYCMSELHHTRKTYVPRPGPMSVLLTRLHQIAWSWSHGVGFVDHLGSPIDLRECPVQELKDRLSDAWQARTRGMVIHRKTFDGIQWTSSKLTMAGTKHLSAEEKSILRVCLNGTFFTADRRKHQQPDSDTTCQFCGKPDSQVHRQWLCEHFIAQRTVTMDQAKSIAEMKPCIAAHGWMPEPPSLNPYRKMLQSLASESSLFVSPPELPAQVFAFTDGSCRAPTCSLSKLASWGVVIAETNLQNFWPLAGGVVPGHVQTALRGEITAAISACEYALQIGRELHLWTDNDLVYRRILKFQQKQCYFKPNQKDADLWKILHQRVRQLGVFFLGVTKVCSHQDVSTAEDEYEAWVFKGNAAADHVADTAVYQHVGLYKLWQSLQQEIAHIHMLRNHVHRTLIQVGKHAVRSGTGKPPDKQHAERISREEIAEADFSPIPVDCLPGKYMYPYAEELLSWLHQLVDPSEPVRCISWFQVNVIFEHQTRRTGVRHIKSRKQWVEGERDTKHIDFVRRTNYLSDWVQGVWRSANRPIKLLHLRPESNVLQFWTQCLALRIRAGLVQLADEVLMESQVKVSSVRSLRYL